MKEQFIKNAQAAFLRETVKFYNSNNRATDGDSGGCVYHPTSSSPGCAIGRHQPNKELCVQWTMRAAEGYVKDIASHYSGTLGALEVLGVDFLAHVQSLHDSSRYWTNYGISLSGVRGVEHICDTFELPIEQVLLDNCAENGN